MLCKFEVSNALMNAALLSKGVRVAKDLSVL